MLNFWALCGCAILETSGSLEDYSWSPVSSSSLTPVHHEMNDYLLLPPSLSRMEEAKDCGLRN